jgi:hypothetical protein
MEETKNKATALQASAPKTGKLNVNNALLVVVGLLIIMSAIQIFQFQQLAQAVSGGAVKVNAQPAGGAANLPSQVGGCGI